ncbi:hypothetical protein CU097_011041 [Rhizopus azygosporus]|uniref:Polyketide synthase-like phosphopantetheine-binding domain-containing protein n=1 Tax=Rhizopus azygosporus TaxID=86630 RepID=A0A367JLK5_RHIAZ|nr:hypothetical protein CU097_011041 [Rhizopus azygosporus]
MVTTIFSTSPSEINAEEHMTLINYLNKVCKDNGDRIVAYYHSNNGFHSLTYAQVDLIATNLACKWSSIIKDTRTVSYLADHSIDYLIVLLALLKLRVTPFLISPRNSQAAIVHLMKTTQSKFLLASKKYQSIAMAISSSVKGMRELIISPLQLDVLTMEPYYPDYRGILNHSFISSDITKTTLIMHSSGTTNFPKPIYCSNRYMFKAINFLNILQSSEHAMLPVDHNDVFLVCAPMFHSFGIACVFQIIVDGGSIVYLEKLPPSQNEIAQALRSVQCTMMSAPPLILEQMLSVTHDDLEYRESLARLKYIFFGGAPLRFDTGEKFHEYNINVRAIYGSTEFGAVMAADLDRNSRNWYAFRPFIKDPNGQEYCLFETVDCDVKHMVIRGDCPNLATGLAQADGYSSNDLFKEHPDFSGYYIYLNRRDNILIMENGEKTNPAPMEMTIANCSVVNQVIVLGHGRQCTAALVELHKEYMENGQQNDAVKMVYDAVEEANKECPSHSMLLKQMVKILPPGKTLPTTVKGGVSRKAAEEMYKDTIESMYKAFINGPQIQSTSPVSQSPKKVKEFLIDSVSATLNMPKVSLQDTSCSLFSLGLTSLSAIQLRNLVASEYNHIPQDFVYQFSNIDAMCRALTTANIINKPVQKEQQYGQTRMLTKAYIKRAIVDFPVVKGLCATKDRDLVILLTGATGSLGSFLLCELLKSRKVRKVYCMVRGNSDIERRQRMEEALLSRMLDVSLLDDTSRIELLPMDLNDPYLGLYRDRYLQLQWEIDMVQHCAWMLDFNRTVADYDKECISPFYNLLKFAYREFNPMRVHFISSVSASAKLGNLIEEVPLPFNPGVAMPKGYAQSKFIVEVLLNYLVTKKKWPCFIERLGQVCGDTEHGVWNISEQYPLMFIGGARMMKKMPRLDTVIDWIPINYAAASISEIMLHTSTLQACTDTSVYHVVNPKIITWSDILCVMKEVGIAFDVVSPSEWVQELSGDMNNPAYRLLSFYKTNLTDSFKMPVWQTERTREVSPTLNKAPAVDPILFKKCLEYWEQKGFLSSL